MVKWLPLLLLLAGCTVGPDYHLPQQAVVNAPAANGAFASTGPGLSTAALPPHWWRLYRSAELDRLVTTALIANTDLRVAEANLQRSHALLEEARAGRDLGVMFNFQPQYGQLSAEQYLQPQIIPPTGLYDIGLGVSYDLDLFGRIRRGVEAARADDQAAQAARDLVEVNVVATVASAYADLCGAGGEIAAIRDILALQQQQLNNVLRLRAAGRATSLEANRNQALVAQARASEPLLDARQRNDLYLLATLTGRPPAQFDRTLACKTVPTLDQPVPVGDGAALLRRRPDIRETERQLAAATARIGVATADLYPRITLTAGVGSTGALTDFLSPLTNRFAIGPGITWELNQNAARARIAAADAAAQAALAHFDGVVLGALRETETALTSYSKGLDRLASLREARDRARQSYRDAQRLQTAGRGTSLDVLDAERTLATTEAALATADSQLAVQQVAIFLALGGGWEPLEVPD